MDPPSQGRFIYIPSIYEGHVKKEEGPHQSDIIPITKRWGSLSEATYFDKLAEDGEVTHARPYEQLMITRI